MANLLLLIHAAGVSGEFFWYIKKLLQMLEQIYIIRYSESFLIALRIGLNPPYRI